MSVPEILRPKQRTEAHQWAWSVCRAHLCAPPGMGEELQSHVKIKVSQLPLLRLFHTAPHLPELESFCQDESPQDTPESPPLPPFSPLYSSCPVDVFSARCWTSSSDNNDITEPLINPLHSLCKNLAEAPPAEPYFTSVTLIRDLGG